jgi:hypothetical protein
MNYVLQNPPLVYLHQRASRPQRIVSSEGPRTVDTYERWCQSTASSNNSVEQLRLYVLQRCSKNCKKII